MALLLIHFQSHHPCRSVFIRGQDPVTAAAVDDLELAPVDGEFRGICDPRELGIGKRLATDQHGFTRMITQKAGSLSDWSG